MELDIKRHLETTWKIFSTNLFPLLLLTAAMIAGSLLTLGIMAPVLTAGYMQSFLLLIRDGRIPEIRDLMSEKRLFWPLIAFTLIVALIAFVGLKILILPGLIFMAILVFSCLYMLPLMTDRDMKIIDAIRASYQMAMKKPIIDHLVVIGVYAILTAIGQSFFLLTIFTQPFATLFVLSIYEEKMKNFTG